METREFGWKQHQSEAAWWCIVNNSMTWNVINRASFLHQRSFVVILIVSRQSKGLLILTLHFSHWFYLYVQYWTKSNVTNGIERSFLLMLLQDCRFDSEILVSLLWRSNLNKMYWQIRLSAACCCNTAKTRRHFLFPASHVGLVIFWKQRTSSGVNMHTYIWRMQYVSGEKGRRFEWLHFTTTLAENFNESY